jgi:hypothetical protein
MVRDPSTPTGRAQRDWMDLDAVNKLLDGRPDLLGMTLSWNPVHERYEAVFSLAMPGDARSHVSVLFIGLSGLRLADVGHGVAELRCLRVRDLSDRQWDRAPYEVVDLDDAGGQGSLRFFCQRVEVLDAPETRSQGE